jgi:hypothetical protein
MDEALAGKIDRRKATVRFGLTVVLSLQLTLLPRPSDAAEPVFPPSLPGGRQIVVDESTELLKRPEALRESVLVARTPPSIEFQYFPGQTYPGRPWSAWGDSLAVGGKYYASLGDHLAPQGTGRVYEYDRATKELRWVLDVRKLLALPEGHYTPGKIHSRLDLADDGWIYFSTHRGSTKATTDANHYRGDWILRYHPGTGAAEVVAWGPVPKHCIPTGIVDPKRMIFYGATTPGDRSDDEGIQFFAYDLKGRKMLYAGPNGPSRAIALARRSGRVYFVPGSADRPLLRFDPASGGPPVEIPGVLGMRAASQETPQGVIYTVSQGAKNAQAMLYAFDVRTEAVTDLGPAAVGTQQYITSLDADPTGRYLYYVPGAHGGSDRDGSPIVQFDVPTRQRKVLAFLSPFYQQKYGCTPRGTYSLAVSPEGDVLYVTWNVSRGSKAWDCCALTVVHVPAAERQP